MATLGIRGNSLFYSKIKKILITLGGKDTGDFKCKSEDNIYYIDNLGYISAHSLVVFDNEDVKALERFYKVTIYDFNKFFPYELGDKVYVKKQKRVGLVKDIKWSSYDNTILYEIESLGVFDADYTATVDELEVYNNQDVVVNTSIEANTGTTNTETTISNLCDKFEINYNPETHEVLVKNGKVIIKKVKD
jgi:hypothetical protein